MTENDVKMCLTELKNKKCEGFDRIPACMILDARVPYYHICLTYLMKYTALAKYLINGK